jgi:hypothetical protein
MVLRSLIGILAILAGVYTSVLEMTRDSLAHPFLMILGVAIIFFGISSLVSRRKLVLSLLFLVSFIGTIVALVDGSDLKLVFLAITVISFLFLLLRNRMRGTYARGESDSSSIFGNGPGRRSKIGAALSLTAGSLAIYLYGIIGALDSMDSGSVLNGYYSMLLAVALAIVVLAIVLVFRAIRVVVLMQTIIGLVGLVVIVIAWFRGMDTKQALLFTLPLLVHLVANRLVK